MLEEGGSMVTCRKGGMLEEGVSMVTCRRGGILEQRGGLTVRGGARRTPQSVCGAPACHRSIVLSTAGSDRKCSVSSCCKGIP